jgi:hypothetical protein
MIERSVMRARRLASIRDGFGGDIYRRKLVEGSENQYTCGCRWTRNSRWGDVLVLCDLHKEHSEARWEQMEKSDNAKR